MSEYFLLSSGILFSALFTLLGVTLNQHLLVQASFPIELFHRNFITDKDDTRIVGGYASTAITLFPYQASLQYQKSHICGGSIITERIILTAAHCIELPDDPASYQVRVGSVHHRRGGQLLNVSRILQHEMYTSSAQNNDVALIELASAITATLQAAPIMLASAGDSVPKNTHLIVSGWGFTSETTSNVSPVLRYVEVKLLPHASCVANYQKIVAVTEEMFCAGSAEGGRDSCQGDSGGPLVGELNGQLKLFGVVSWGMGCGQVGYPGVYANVAKLRTWIDRAVLQISRQGA